MHRHIRIAALLLPLLALALLGRRAQRALDADDLMRRGEQRLANKDADAAERDFRRAHQLAPEDERTLNAVARALQARGEVAAALAAQETVLADAERDDWSLDALAVELRNVGLLRYQRGDLPGAAAAFARLRGLDATWLEPDLLECVTALRRGEVAKVRSLLQRLRARYGDIEPLWRVGMAAAAVDAGSRPTGLALEAFTTLRAAPAGIDAARAQLGPGLDREPIALAVLADVAFAAEDFATAGSAWKGLVVGPLDALAHVGLGRLALRADDPRAALVHFDAAAADASVPRELIGFWRGQSLQESGNLAAARAALLPAIPANPLALRAETLLGVVESQGGDLQAAEATFGRVLAVEPKHGEALYQCGKMLLGAGRRDAGSQLLQRYLAAHPSGRYAAEVRQLVAG